MREAINSNPVVQLGLLAVLGIGIAFMLMTRMGGDPPSSAPPTATDPTGAASPAISAAGESQAEPESPAQKQAKPQANGSDKGTSAAELTAGPGLPKPLVGAYNRGDTVVLLITRDGGIEDNLLRGEGKALNADRAEVTLLHTRARNIADYSRITQGVAINRVPAMVVLSSKNARQGVPVASVSYGFRGYESVEQAVRDAAYRGKNLPYYPN